MGLADEDGLQTMDDEKEDEKEDEGGKYDDNEGRPYESWAVRAWLTDISADGGGFGAAEQFKTMFGFGASNGGVDWH
jgi:hypothetical protein